MSNPITQEENYKDLARSYSRLLDEYDRAQQRHYTTLVVVTLTFLFILVYITLGRHC
jgi:hypothetical protein